MASNEHAADHSDPDPTVASGGGDETLLTPTGVSPAPAGFGRDELVDKAGDQVGSYKLISKLGEGGFGTVWLAERRQPFVQQVALKIVKLGMDSKSVVARFEQERQALAVMNHPNVAKVLDGGLTPTGRPYFAMEYVKGEPITDYCDRQKLTIKQRLQLFVQVCEAVQHAHTKGIIHRDLKPGNILVASGDGDVGQAKVIDFGVAKALTQRMTEHTVFTETGQMIGTPSYMSPEQAEPDANDIDTRSDVYSLGVILYELLSGALPFDPEELRRKAYREIQRIIREDDPPSPSARLSTIATKDTALATRIAQARKEAASTLTRVLRSELEWIPLKALRKERAERYDSPADLARDVQNYVEGRPLVAAPPSASYRARKYIRRHRGYVIAVASVLAAAFAGLGLTTWQWMEARTAKASALESAARATAQQVAAEQARGEALAQRDAATVARREAETQSRRSEQAQRVAESERKRAIDLLAVASSSAALRAVQRNDLQTADRELEAARQIGATHSFAFGLASAALHDAEAAPLKFTEALSQRSPWAFSSDGHLWAGVDDGILILDLRSGKRRRLIQFSGRDSYVQAIAFNHDGSVIAGALSDGSIRRWAVETGREIGAPMREHALGSRSVAFHPGGKRLATGGEDGVVRIWDLSSDPPSQTVIIEGQPPVSRISYSPDGRSLCVLCSEELALIWGDLNSQTTPRALVDFGRDFAFSTDSTMLAATFGEDVDLWDVKSLRRIAKLYCGPTRDLTFCPDGSTLAMLGTTGDIQIWDVAKRKVVAKGLRDFPFEPLALVASSDDCALMSVGHGRLYRWSIPALIEITRNDQLEAEAAPVLAFNPSSGVLATGNPNNGTVCLWDPDNGSQIGLRIDAGQVRHIAMSRDGSTLVIGCKYGDVSVWNTRTRQLISSRLGKRDELLTALSADETGELVAIAIALQGPNEYSYTAKGHFVELWRPTAPEQPIATLSADRKVTNLSFAPDAKTLAWVDGSLHLLDLVSMSARAEPTRNFGVCLERVAFGQDGQLLVTAGWASANDWTQGVIEIRSADSGNLVRSIITDERTDRVAISPDCKTIASGNQDRRNFTSYHSRIRLWDVATGLEFGDGIADYREETDIAFSPDGMMLAATTPTGTRLFCARSYQDRAQRALKSLHEANQASSVVEPLTAEARANGADMTSVQAAVLNDLFLDEGVRRASLELIAKLAINDTDSVPEEPNAEGGDPASALRENGWLRRIGEIALAAERKEWIRALDLLGSSSETTLQNISAHLLSTVAWEALAANEGKPTREIASRVLEFALRATKKTFESEPLALQALALASWNLGERGAAIRAQRRAVGQLEAIGMTAAEPHQGQQARELVLHYVRSNREYTGWNLWVWIPGEEGRAIPFEDRNGDCSARVDVAQGTSTLGIVIRLGEWKEKDFNQDRYVQLEPDGRTEVWAVSGWPTLVTRSSLKAAKDALARFESDTREQPTPNGQGSTSAPATPQ